MTPQQLIRTILDAVAEDDQRKAEDAIRGYTCEFQDFIKDNSYTKGPKGWYKYYEHREDFPAGYSMTTPVYTFMTIEQIYELFTQQNKP